MVIKSKRSAPIFSTKRYVYYDPTLRLKAGAIKVKINVFLT